VPFKCHANSLRSGLIGGGGTRGLGSSTSGGGKKACPLKNYFFNWVKSGMSIEYIVLTIYNHCLYIT